MQLWSYWFWVLTEIEPCYLPEQYSTSVLCQWSLVLTQKLRDTTTGHGRSRQQHATSLTLAVTMQTAEPWARVSEWSWCSWASWRYRLQGFVEQDRVVPPAAPWDLQTALARMAEALLEWLEVGATSSWSKQSKLHFLSVYYRKFGDFQLVFPSMLISSLPTYYSAWSDLNLTYCISQTTFHSAVN